MFLVKLLPSESNICQTPATPCTPATMSAREAAKIAKLQHTEERKRRTSAIKDKWAQEKERKLGMQQERRNLELKQLEAMTQAAAIERKKNIDRQTEIAAKKRKEELDLVSASLKERSQLAEDLKKAEKERRRQSILVNAEIQSFAKKREEALNKKRKEEEESLLETRRLGFAETREYKKIQEDKKRESLATRGSYFKTVKSREEKLLQEKKQNEIDIIENRRKVWLAKREIEQESKKSEREDLIHTLDEWRLQKEKEDALALAELERQQDLLAERYQFWADRQELKQDQPKRDRESIIYRLDKWREERDIEENMRIERELKEIQDRKMYEMDRDNLKLALEEQEFSKRQSMEYKHVRACADRSYEMGKRANEQLYMQEQYETRMEDFKALKRCQKEESQRRRESLQFRLDSLVIWPCCY
jgi:hypothetical protein